MIESQQNRELVLKQLAEAWDEGAEAMMRVFQPLSLNQAMRLFEPVNPYRMKEEKDDHSL